MSRRVVHCKRDPYDVYIGRPSKWGNPYSHLPNTRAQFRVATREEAIEAYRNYLQFRVDDEGGEFVWKLARLHGKVLGCWCAPQPCHGDVLVEFAARAVATVMGRA